MGKGEGGGKREGTKKREERGENIVTEAPSSQVAPNEIDYVNHDILSHIQAQSNTINSFHISFTSFLMEHTREEKASLEVPI